MWSRGFLLVLACLTAGSAIAGIGHGRALAQPTAERDVSPTSRPALELGVGAPLDPMAQGADGEPVLGIPIELYDPSGRALASFYRALRSAEAGEGQARVIVYGASHVASDLFTSIVRDQLQARFGNAGHGFILPARPWRGYRHIGVTVESSRRWRGLRVTASSRDVAPLGYAGMAIESDSRNDWGRIDTETQSAKRFEIFYWRQPGGGGFDVLLDGRRVQRVATAGEAAGPGYAELIAPDDARHVLEIRVRGDGPVRIFGVTMEREVPGVVVDNLGINGARASSHLRWDETLQVEQLRRRRPDLVVLAYGTNESGDDDQPIETYEANLRRVIARVRGTVPSASCMMIGPSDRPLRQPDGTFADRPRTHLIIDVQRRVSRDMGCAFFDLVAFGGGPLHMTQWVAAEPAFAQDDHVHYTLRGYRRLGEVLAGAIMTHYDDAAPVNAAIPE